MADNKKFYWIKLKDTFMNSDAVDFLMGQQNGAEYVVLYQKLCLMAIKTDGKLERKMGEVIIPYDAAKIQRDCKYFSMDTVIVALDLFKKMGLIYAENDGVLQIADWDNIVGSETKWAQTKRLQRGSSNKKKLDNVQTLSSSMSTDVSNVCPKNVHPDIEIEKEIDIKEKNTKKEKSFLSPSLTEKIINENISGEKVRRVFHEFLKMRDGKGKNHSVKTEFNLRLLLGKLRKFARNEEEALGVLNHSIERCYDGLFDVYNITGE